MRMGDSTPKQFFPLKEKIIANYSLEIFISLPYVKNITIVCEQKFQKFFLKSSKISFSLPGKRRQDSVKNGFTSLRQKAAYICIHDAARPLVKKENIDKVFHAAQIHKAAALAVKATSTMKLAKEMRVLKTLDRNMIWEVQTPQILETSLFAKGLHYIQEEGLTVTDDLSIIEALGLPTYLVEGCPSNIKITYPNDLQLAENYLCRSKHTN